IVALNLDQPVPLVSLGYGDLDEAHHLSWNVPGMLNDVDQAFENWDQGMRELYKAEGKLLAMDAGGGLATKKTGMIVFFEYDSPNMPSSPSNHVLFSGSAKTGVDRLVAELNGTFATRGVNLGEAESAG